MRYLLPGEHKSPFQVADCWDNHCMIRSSAGSHWSIDQLAFYVMIGDGFSAINFSDVLLTKQERATTFCSYANILSHTFRLFRNTAITHDILLKYWYHACFFDTWCPVFSLNGPYTVLTMMKCMKIPYAKLPLISLLTVTFTLLNLLLNADMHRLFQRWQKPPVNRGDTGKWCRWLAMSILLIKYGPIQR